MNSCLYECSVMHRRLWPKRNEFVYRIFLCFLDLGELDDIARRIPFFSHNRRNAYAFLDSDHFRIDATRDAAWNASEFFRCNGAPSPARLAVLTLPRFMGYIFNPISLWFGWDADGNPLGAIAEVGNTFRELKPYFLPPQEGGASFHLRAPKHYYVSPFSDLDLDFDFRVEMPGDRLRVHIDDYRGEERILLSTLTGKKWPLTATTLAWLTLKFPFVTLKVISLIHWQALRLWMKGIPFHRKEASPELQRDLFNPHRSIRPKRP